MGPDLLSLFWGFETCPGQCKVPEDGVAPSRAAGQLHPAVHPFGPFTWIRAPSSPKGQTMEKLPFYTLLSWTLWPGAL